MDEAIWNSPAYVFYAGNNENDKLFESCRRRARTYLVWAIIFIMGAVGVILTLSVGPIPTIWRIIVFFILVAIFFTLMDKWEDIRNIKLERERQVERDFWELSETLKYDYDNLLKAGRNELKTRAEAVLTEARGDLEYWKLNGETLEMSRVAIAFEEEIYGLIDGRKHHLKEKVEDLEEIFRKFSLLEK